MIDQKRTRAQISRAAIERLYIAMRHLLVRGHYKPLGRSGEAMLEALHALNPEIYGSLRDPLKVELKGMLYVFQRLPQGIESCPYVHLISREGFEKAEFKPLVPAKRRRNCYRIDDLQMYIEMTRGRSDVYDLLTHLTFMYNEGQKIGHNALDKGQNANRSWELLCDLVVKRKSEEAFPEELATTYLSAILNRTYDETVETIQKFDQAEKVNDLFTIVYELGKLFLNERNGIRDIEISFSSALREKIGHHIYGEQWANTIKSVLQKNKLDQFPMHIVSANMHSVMNWLYARSALPEFIDLSFEELMSRLSQPQNEDLRQQVKAHALEHGLYKIQDTSATNIGVQLIDVRQIRYETLPQALRESIPHDTQKPFLIFVMDYAFGEQAYETMDELLKPIELDSGDPVEKKALSVASINIMGKAGILSGKKGDVMIPTAHVFEGSADNYPVDNQLSVDQFRNYSFDVYEGPMITVLGTSLQNRDVLRYFLRSSWKAVGLEMEGAHYQKAIQSASLIRKSIDPNVFVRYAYYASDNPLETGSTLASGSLGAEGIIPTYAITLEILKGIFNQ